MNKILLFLFFFNLECFKDEINLKKNELKFNISEFFKLISNLKKNIRFLKNQVNNFEEKRASNDKFIEEAEKAISIIDYKRIIFKKLKKNIKKLSPFNEIRELNLHINEINFNKIKFEYLIKNLNASFESLKEEKSIEKFFKYFFNFNYLISFYEIVLKSDIDENDFRDEYLSLNNFQDTNYLISFIGDNSRKKINNLDNYLNFLEESNITEIFSKKLFKNKGILFLNKDESFVGTMLIQIKDNENKHNFVEKIYFKDFKVIIPPQLIYFSLIKIARNLNYLEFEDSLEELNFSKRKNDFMFFYEKNSIIEKNLKLFLIFFKRLNKSFKYSPGNFNSIILRKEDFFSKLNFFYSLSNKYIVDDINFLFFSKNLKLYFLSKLFKKNFLLNKKDKVYFENFNFSEKIREDLFKIDFFKKFIQISKLPLSAQAILEIAKISKIYW